MDSQTARGRLVLICRSGAFPMSHRRCVIHPDPFPCRAGTGPTYKEAVYHHGPLPPYVPDVPSLQCVIHPHPLS